MLLNVLGMCRLGAPAVVLNRPVMSREKTPVFLMNIPGTFAENIPAVLLFLLKYN